MERQRSYSWQDPTELAAAGMQMAGLDYLLHGSVVVALFDSVAGSAVHTTLPAGVGYTTVSITTSFLRPVTVDSGPLRAEGTLIRAGRRTALAEARLHDADGAPHGHAIANCMILGR